MPALEESRDHTWVEEITVRNYVQRVDISLGFAELTSVIITCQQQSKSFFRNTGWYYSFNIH